MYRNRIANVKSSSNTIVLPGDECMWQYLNSDDSGVLASKRNKNGVNFVIKYEER